MRKFQLLLVILLLTMGKTMSFQEQGLITVNATDSTFISTWNTTLTSTGSSDSYQIKLPLESVGNYDFVVNWGDGTSDTITVWDQREVIHTYSLEGIYNLTIDGTLNGWRFAYYRDKLKLLDISQWGDLQLGNSGHYFAGAENLQISALDAPDLSETTTLKHMFSEAFSFNSDIGHWDVSNVTNMDRMFAWATSFNQNIGNWDVSSVTNMKSMFAIAIYFNQDIINWDVSSVIDMKSMFSQASSFNQDISNWDVSSVDDMSRMFYNASSFNQDISNWDVSSVIDMKSMFSQASSFNQDISNWDVSSVDDMSRMFAYATSFNQNIGNWDVSSVIDMWGMFNEVSSFNQPIGNWDVSSVTDMNYMFFGVTLSIENYDNLLIGWAKLPLQSGVKFHAGNSKYSSQSAASRQKIIDIFAWIIIDGGAEEDHVTYTSSDTPSSIEITTTEDAFLNIPHFYTLSPLLVFVIIRIKIKKKKYPKKIHN